MARRIIDNVYQLEGLRGARVHLLVGTDGLVLVDAGLAQQVEAIRDELRGLGQDLKEVRAIVATHSHSDHTGNLAALAAATGAEVWAHAEEASFIDGTQRLPLRPGLQRGLFGIINRMNPAAPVPVDRTLTDGEEVEAPVRFTVLHLPGHTPGCLALHLPEERLAIIGDALFGGIPFKGPLSLPPRIVSVDPSEARRSAQKLADLELEIVCQSHGEPVLHGGAAAIAKALAARS